MTENFLSCHSQAIKQFIDLLNSQHQPRKVITPETAIQYLSARKFDVPKAVALYEANNLTRQREGLFGINSKSDPLRSELETGKFTVLVSLNSTFRLSKSSNYPERVYLNSFIKRRSVTKSNFHFLFTRRRKQDAHMFPPCANTEKSPTEKMKTERFIFVTFG